MTAALDELRARSEALLVPRAAPDEARAELPAARPRAFTPFLVEHLAAAQGLAEQLMTRADEDGLEAAVAEAERAARTQSRDLVEWAWMIFLTHHPQGSKLPLPALEERHPEQFMTPGVVEMDVPVTLEPERGLDWFREDPLANQHHEHWHVVYRGRGPVNDRHGELFFYMHQQMLARYDAERLALGGLQPVAPLTDYRAPIPEGYRPNVSGFAERRPGATLVDVTLDGRSFPLGGHEELRRRLEGAVQSGAFAEGTEVTPNLLGATVEPNDDSVSVDLYGNHHGFGHVFIALVHSPDDYSRPGVMWDPRSAIMDPVFYRWHRHVDDFLFDWQEEQDPNDLSDAPEAVLRKSLNGAESAHASPDIILAFTDRIPAGVNPLAWGEESFGGDHWDHAFAHSEATTAELETEMKTRDSPAGPVAYLDHRDFAYFLRVENPGEVDIVVTVRIFLAPVASAENRRLWIEMDKFRASLGQRQRAVLARPGALASVIQKPAVRPPRPRREAGSDAATNYCNCGWPFHLLVPRGTSEGMPFRLLVMLTDWELDQVPDESSCGSMSFCGVRDRRYPDRRPMGYPFDRPFPNGIANVVARQQNMAARDITIRTLR